MRNYRGFYVSSVYSFPLAISCGWERSSPRRQCDLPTIFRIMTDDIRYDRRECNRHKVEDDPPN